MGVQHRPAYQRLLAALARTPSPFDVLLVDDLSRLSRDAAEILRFVRVLQEMGLKLISVADGIETGTKLSKLALSVKAIINEVYLDDLRDRTLRGLQGRFARGLLPEADYGYRSVPVPDRRRRCSGTPAHPGRALDRGSHEAIVHRSMGGSSGIGASPPCGSPQHQTIPFPPSTHRGQNARVGLKCRPGHPQKWKYRGRWVYGRRLFFGIH
jgi:hypothetical protein